MIDNYITITSIEELTNGDIIHISYPFKINITPKERIYNEHICRSRKNNLIELIEKGRVKKKVKK